MAQQKKQNRPKQPQDPYAQQSKQLTSAVQRLRGWVGSDPSRTPELADALVRLTEHRLLGHAYTVAAPEAQESVKLAAQLLTAHGPIGPYTSVDDAARYLTAVVHLGVIQGAAGLPVAGAETVGSLTELRGQLGSLPLVEALGPATVIWALTSTARGALAAGDLAGANAHADAALQRLTSSDLRSQPEAAYVVVDTHRLVSDARWAAGLADGALIHLHLARETYDRMVEGRLSRAGQLAPALVQRLSEPLYEVYRDLADRLLSVGEVDLGLVTRRQLIDLLRGLADRDEVARVQLAASLADLVRDLRAVGRVEEADLVAEDLDAVPAGDRATAGELAAGLARGEGGLQWAPLSAFAAYAGAQAVGGEEATAVEADLQRELAARLAAEREEARRIEGERLEEARLAAERRAAERTAADRLAAERAETQRIEAERVAAEQAEAARREAERSAEEEEAERRERKRRREERIEAHRLEQERLEVERAEAERLAMEQREAERRAADPAELERLELERLQAELVELERAEAEAAASDAEVTEAEATEAEAAEAARVEAEESARVEIDRLAEERRAAERAEEERAKAEAWETRRRDEQRLEAERAAAAQVEAERIKAERAEAERAEAERAEAERAEAERAEAERAEAERAEAERAEAERAEAEPVEAEPQTVRLPADEPTVEAPGPSGPDEVVPAPIESQAEAPAPVGDQPTEPAPAQPQLVEDDELTVAYQAWQDAKAGGDRRTARGHNERLVELLRPLAEHDLAAYGPRLLYALEELSSARLRAGELFASRGPAREAKALAKALGRR